MTVQHRMEPATAREFWYRQPVVWLGATILLASIAGCIGLMILASRYPDEPVEPSADKVLRVPVTREHATLTMTIQERCCWHCGEPLQARH